MNNGRIDDRAGLDADALSRQMQVHCVEHGTAKVMLFEQVPEAQHGRFIRRRSHAQVDASEPPQRGGLVKRLFDAGVGQVGVNPTLTLVANSVDEESTLVRKMILCVR